MRLTKPRRGTPRRDERGEVERAHKALARIDRLLNEAEGVIGSSLSSVEFRKKYPKAYDAADKAFTYIEQARRSLAYRR
jgi:hypothetical protein